MQFNVQAYDKVFFSFMGKVLFLLIIFAKFFEFTSQYLVILFPCMRK